MRGTMDDYASSDGIGMDGGFEDPADGEYAALHDPIQVMAEVLRLVGELRRSADRLGDAIVKAGFAARDWRSRDAWLPDLPGELPEIALDDLLTRLAEFAADAGPHWLREGTEGIERFHDETLILYDVIRPLRSFAQRQRMLPVRDRGDHPLWRTFGDARVGTPLDRVANHLRDLDSLAPFAVALAPRDWSAVEATLAAGGEARAAVGERSREEAAPSLASSAAAAERGDVQRPARSAEMDTPAWLVADSSAAGATAPSAGSSAAGVPPAGVPPASMPPADEPVRHARRLWDFAPHGKRPDAGAARRPAEGHAPSGLRAFVMTRRWAVVGIAAALLAMGTGLLTLVAHEQNMTPSPKPSHLTATPASLALACTGKGSTVSFTLQDTGTAPQTWSVKPPAGVKLSGTGGTLKPGASVTLRLSVSVAKAAQGTLVFTDADGNLAVPYTISCGK